MTDALVQSIPGRGVLRWRVKQFTSHLGRVVREAWIARRTRAELDALSEELIRDIGLTRADIPFVAGAVAAGRPDFTRDPIDRLNRSVADPAVPSFRPV
jgi:uncharacterized protein YjiS (DUF1127 family)